VALGLLAGVALTANPAQAVNAIGLYYAEPAWDRKIPAETRFVVLTNWNSEAVLDKETGLVWERSPATTPQTWDAARVACTGRMIGNRKSWRLPSVHELASLVDPAQNNPALPLGHPFLTVQSTTYWSATTNAEDPTLALFLSFGAGGVFTSDKPSSRQAWCVRGGMNADQY
jgi:hypothetical protein